MTFTPKTWQNYEAGGTPIIAAELNRIEQAISDVSLSHGWRSVPVESQVAAGGRMLLHRSGVTVSVHLESVRRDALGGDLLVGTLPSGYRPAQPQVSTPAGGLVAGVAMSSTATRRVQVGADGAVTILGLAANTSYWSLLTFTTDEPLPAPLPGSPA